MTTMTVKCRKCRNLLFVYPEVDVLTAHGESYGNVGVEYISCETIQEDNVWYLGETGIPEWISSYVNEANWTKGKVNCPNCKGRLGSFDFISGNQCQCGSHTLPPIHIVKCKVDCRFQNKVCNGNPHHEMVSMTRMVSRTFSHDLNVQNGCAEYRAQYSCKICYH